MSKTCPGCGETTSGRFCSGCGAPLDVSQRCAECDQEIPPGGRFCSQCGSAVGSRAMAPEAQALPVDASPSGPDRAGAPSLPWIVAAASLLALLGVIAFILLPGARSPGDPSAPIAAPLGDPAGIDLATMTPRDAADRLFNRVMERVSAGDTTEARAFQPMALAAYERVEELDLDGHYHVALLQLVGGDPQAARARADTILRQVPNHLLGLHTAAQAEERMGNPDAAVPLYVQFLENYEEEVAVGRSEYREHAPVLPLLRQEAESAAGGTR